jgi:hypothetical protein
LYAILYLRRARVARSSYRRPFFTFNPSMAMISALPLSITHARRNAVQQEFPSTRASGVCPGDGSSSQFLLGVTADTPDGLTSG